MCLSPITNRYITKSGVESGFESAVESALPLVFRVVALSALLSMVFLSSQQLSRLVIFQWLVPRSLMGYLWHCDCTLGFYLTLFYDHIKAFHSKRWPTGIGSASE